MEFSRPRGTRDFLPEEVRKRRAIEGRVRESFERFGYSEVATPTFEHLELITAKSGDEIREGIYHFKDKSKRDLALRPELTAPVMRLYVNGLQKSPKPVKLYYIANCFRYERSQAGRYREFWQAGVESMGSGHPEAEAEVIALAVKTLENAGLKDFDVQVGNIGILRGLLKDAGASEAEQDTLMGVIDKGDKGEIKDALSRFPEDARALLVELIGLSGSRKNVIEKAEDLLKGREGPLSALLELKDTLAMLEKFGVNDCKVNLGISRGLDYYTGMVFEIYARGLGAQSQVCGGGTYTLAPVFGGQKTATSGFAFGFDRVMLALEAEGALPTEKGSVKYLVVPTGPELIGNAMEIAAKIRKVANCDVDLMRRKLGKALSYADSRGIPYVVIVGESELKKGRATVRDMETGEQKGVDIGEIR